MEGAARVFASEFMAASLLVPDDRSTGSLGFVVTPTGAWCRTMYICGALTEFSERGGVVQGRIADPTGVFEIVSDTKPGGVAVSLGNMPVPSFVAVTGLAQMYRGNSSPVISLRPETARIIDRQSRDQWVLVTAGLTLARLRQMVDAFVGTCTDERLHIALKHYALTPQQIASFADMVEQAVISVRLPVALKSDLSETRGIILGIIQTGSGPRGISVEAVITLAQEKGISSDAALAALNSLVRDDECYQPQKGFVRLL